MQPTIQHELWQWCWYFFGVATYILKRAYFLVKGPNPVANTYKEFFKVCWIPLLVRTVADSAIFWCGFYPDFANPILSKLGFSWQLHSPMSAIPAPGVLFIGLGIDSAVDFAVTKIPWLKDWWPQMPPPLTKPTQPAGGQ